MFGESPGTSEVGCWEEFALKLSASFGEQSGPQDPPIMALLPFFRFVCLADLAGIDRSTVGSCGRTRVGRRAV